LLESIGVFVIASLQATWTNEGSLFFWAAQGKLRQVISNELPALLSLGATETRRSLAVPKTTLRRKPVAGLELPVGQSIGPLIALSQPLSFSDSIQCWSLCAKFALELAASQRVVPSVNGNQARWRALISRNKDRLRMENLVRALPSASRAAPTSPAGRIALTESSLVVRSFIDTAIDHIYRQNRYPGSCRGWELSLAESLKGKDCGFQIRDARHQSIPDKLSGWSSAVETASLQLLIRLGLTGDPNGPFTVDYFVRAPDHPEQLFTLADVWTAGDSIHIGEQPHYHPAYTLIRLMARAARIFPPLAASLKGGSPQALTWQAMQAWQFMESGSRRLMDAGFDVEIPDVFKHTGRQRVRARMRLLWDESNPHPFSSETNLEFTWEVVLGERVLDGDDFGSLLAQRSPLVFFQGEWIILDPSEVERLPDGLPQAGSLRGHEALKAILTGKHQGIAVVPDSKLQALVESLKTPELQMVPTGLRGTLRRYQRVGYSWLYHLGELGLGACLADDMGLGKTIQLIAYLLRRHQMCQDRPNLIVCPTSVIGNWTRELAHFAPSLSVVQYHGLERELDSATQANVVLTTYGLLVRDGQDLAKVDWNVLTLDEAQAIKNPSSRRSLAARSLRARHRVSLTGTPIENRLEELWALMAFLNPEFLGSRNDFVRHVTLPIERFGDEQVAEQLRQSVGPFLLRRLKNDPSVIQDLPEKIERRVYCPLTQEQATLYRSACEAGLAAITGQQAMERRGKILALLTALKQICNHPSHYLGDSGPLEERSAKLERCLYLIRTIASRSEYIILFTQYREMGLRLQRAMKERFGWSAPFLHGGSTIKQREHIVETFQSHHPPAPVLLVSLRAGGTGLNLTRATHVIHYDRWWNPAVEDQATDRAYRIGQHQKVQVYKLVCQSTLEERIDAILEEKRALAEAVIGGGESWLTELDDDGLRAVVSLGNDAHVRQ
jgi:hypothetical protein